MTISFCHIQILQQIEHTNNIANVNNGLPYLSPVYSIYNEYLLAAGTFNQLVFRIVQYD